MFLKQELFFFLLVRNYSDQGPFSYQINNANNTKNYSSLLFFALYFDNIKLDKMKKKKLLKNKSSQKC